MKTLLFPGTGFPGGIKTLQALQDNTMNAVKGLARQHENYTVLYGMEVNSGGTQISAGAFVYNGEIIPFLVSPAGTKITINEVIEQANFNTNPDNQTSLEMLNAYSFKSAQTGTGGIHTFDTVKLKRYSNQLIIDKGITVGEYREFSEGVLICEHKLLTQDEINNSMIIYTLTKENDSQSTVGGAKHFLLRRSINNFMISYDLNLAPMEKPKIQWQIVKM